MPLEPTEREEHFFKAMVDAADGSAPEELEPTERKEHWYKEIIDSIKSGGGGSGGGDTEYVTFTLDDNLGTYVCDHSLGQIAEALHANKKVVGVFVDQGEGYLTKSFLPSFFNGSIDEGGGSSYFAAAFYGVGVSIDHGLPAMSTFEAIVTSTGAVNVRINLL